MILLATDYFYFTHFLQTLPFIEHNGNNLGYILTVQCLNCASVQSSAVNTTVIGDWRTDRIVYTSFKAGVVVSEIESYKLFRASHLF